MEEESVKELWQRGEMEGMKFDQGRIGVGLFLSSLFFSITQVMNALFTNTLLLHYSSYLAEGHY